MTAEIGILNKTAVALAADSAVTIPKLQGHKIYNSANKLFALSKYHPVGIMLFGGATFMGVPWETIIKVYRSRLKSTKFKTLKQYADNFIEFVSASGSTFIPMKQQEDYVKSHVRGYFQMIKAKIKKQLEQAVGKQGKLNEGQIADIVKEIIVQFLNESEKSGFLASVTDENKKEFLSKFDEEINKTIPVVFEKLPIDEDVARNLKNIAMGLFFRSGNFTKDTSGIVFSGFGDDEIFPSIYAYRFECIVENIPKYIEHTSGSIHFDNNALIVPFAQSEMVHTFIEGIDPSLEQLSLGYLSQVFEKYPDILLEEVQVKDGLDKKELSAKLKGISQNILKDYIEKNKKYRQDVHVAPIVNIVSILPKDELASMAEALVNLTSFKRRVTMDAETVGGPIDVAVISKGDGFVWIKRKHYFKPELNPHFFKNYFREGGEDEIEQE